MKKNEWSLVGFTLLAQASVGLVCCLQILYLIQPEYFGQLTAGFSLESPLFFSLLFLAGATSFSFLHLGKPQHAPNVFLNLKSSWLSREVFGLILFSLALLVLTVIRFLNLQNGAITSVILAFTTLSGLLLLFFMSKIYNVKTIPPWNSSFTWLSFYLSAFVLGSIMMLIIARNQTTEDQITQNSAITIITGILMMSLIFESISLLAWYLHLNGLSKRSPLKPDYSCREFLLPLTIRAVLIIISLIITIFIFYQIQKGGVNLSNLQWPVFILFSSSVSGEILGRLLFYKSYFRIGV